MPAANLLAIMGLIVYISGCSAQSPLLDFGEGTSEPNGGRVLLEVFTTSEGTVEPEGGSLDLRLFSNGEAEFSFLLTPNDVDVGSLRLVTKRTVLSENDYNQLVSLLSKKDLIDAKDNYEPTIEFSDVLTTTTVWFRHKIGEKTIILRETDTTLHLSKKKDVYPQSLIELLSLISDIREEFK